MDPRAGFLHDGQVRLEPEQAERDVVHYGAEHCWRGGGMPVRDGNVIISPPRKKRGKTEQGGRTDPIRLRVFVCAGGIG